MRLRIPLRDNFREREIRRNIRRTCPVEQRCRKAIVLCQPKDRTHIPRRIEIVLFIEFSFDSIGKFRQVLTNISNQVDSPSSMKGCTEPVPCALSPESAVWLTGVLVGPTFKRLPISKCLMCLGLPSDRILPKTHLTGAVTRSPNSFKTFGVIARRNLNLSGKPHWQFTPLRNLVLSLKILRSRNHKHHIFVEIKRNRNMSDLRKGRVLATAYNMPMRTIRIYKEPKPSNNLAVGILRFTGRLTSDIHIASV